MRDWLSSGCVLLAFALGFVWGRLWKEAELIFVKALKEMAEALNRFNDRHGW